MQPKDDFLVSKALLNKYVTTSQVEECKVVLNQLLLQGKNISLGEIFLAKKYLTEQQIADIVSDTILQPKRYMIEDRYEIINEIGRGGMGIVYKAYDTHLNRTVAIKTLIRDDTDEITIKRFQREAKTCAKLKHPHIINIYDTGVYQQKNFFTMEYVEGISLKEYIKKESLSTPKIAALMEKICIAMHYAHSHNIIHRDLKPSNIIIVKNDEPKIMDFGLAYSTNATKISQSGMVLGTLSYMPPEQLEARRRDIDKRSDVYSLGAILYEMLTLQAPFEGDYLQVLHNILRGIFVHPAQIKPDTSVDLENVCLKAMNKDKESRYKNAMLMAEDLAKIKKGGELEKKLSFVLKQYPQKITLAILACIFFFIGSSFSFSPKVTKKEPLTINIPQNIWKACWDQNNEWFDFTQEIWLDLSHEQQQKYAEMYQQWYAYYINEDLQKAIVVGQTSIEMILIPPGKFWMGNHSSEKTNLNYRRDKVGLYRPFYISKYEISESSWYGAFAKTNKSLQPISNISWDEATLFCEMIGVLLPTEAQWEYACRAGTTSLYYTGNTPPQNSHNQKNSWGCFGFQNNIGEWCFDYAMSNEIFPDREPYIYKKIDAVSSNIEPCGFWDGKSEEQHIYRGFSTCGTKKINGGEGDYIGMRVVSPIFKTYTKVPQNIYKSKTIAKLSAKNIDNNQLENQGFVLDRINGGFDRFYPGRYQRLGLVIISKPFKAQFKLAPLYDKLILHLKFHTLGSDVVKYSHVEIKINGHVFQKELINVCGSNAEYYWEIPQTIINEGDNTIEMKLIKIGSMPIWFFNLEVIGYDKNF